MKKIIVTSLILGGGLLLAGGANAGIAGSAHDLSAFATPNNPQSQLCIYCHTPHHSDTSVNDAPLWNHEVTATASFTLYTSATLNATLGQPNGVSRLCLSCHDGTVALDAFGGMAGTAGNVVSGSALVGTDLSNDHPISFVYNTALATADGGLFDPATKDTGSGQVIEDDWLFSGNAFECASCHDVHDDANVPFLRKDNAASALCLTCHDK